MLRRHGAYSYKHMLVSDSETESDNRLTEIAVAGGSRRRNPRGKRNNGKGKKSLSADEADEVARPFKSKHTSTLDRDALVELAKKYQEHMKKIPLPTGHLDAIVFVNWKGLAQNLKRLYRQPLHYLTYMLCKEWDKSRFGSEDEGKPLNTILSWRDAEDAIWKVETVHRTCTSPIHLAMLWLGDPEYHVIVNEVIPSRSS
ncbi:protein RDM1 [Cajanus cajan]|nr:protein RDM1 [Cajanus cajan]